MMYRSGVDPGHTESLLPETGGRLFVLRDACDIHHIIYLYERLESP
jgi:hypothetical protein